MSIKIAQLHTLALPEDRLSVIAVSIAVNIVNAMPLVELTENNVATEYLSKVHGKAMVVVRAINQSYPLDIDVIFNLLPKLYKVRHELQTNVQLMSLLFKGLLDFQEEIRLRTIDFPQVHDYMVAVRTNDQVRALDSLVESIVRDLV